MQKSTFKLTKHELDFISDPYWMSLKQKLIRTISDSMHGVGQWIMDEYYAGTALSYKVTRGENYLDMPYLVLDAPQLKPNALEGKLRIMLWWGHYISLQLFVKPAVLLNINTDTINSKNYLVLAGDQLFNNNLDTKDFIPLSAIRSGLDPGQEMTKICIKIEWTEMEHIEQHIREFMNDLGSCLALSSNSLYD